MKKQRFIAIMKDGNNNQVNFERFSNGRIKEVENGLNKLLSSELYKTVLKLSGAVTIEIYKTENTWQGLKPEKKIKIEY